MNFAITTGKFWPPHRGHHLMIQTMIDFFGEDGCAIVVSNDSIDDTFRAATFLESKYNVKVSAYPDDLDPMGYDEHGTALNDNYVTSWAHLFKDLYPEVTHFVSTDMYGKIVAEKMSVDWFPVDPDREVFNVSSTMIRNNPEENFKYIMEDAKPLFTTKVAIIGPESTGKSTLVKKLGDHFKCPIVPEYGRIIVEAKGNELTYDDFFKIMYTQETMINEASKHSNGLVISDTDGHVTQLYAKEYLDSYDAARFEFITRNKVKKQNFDLVFSLAPTVPWIDDGTREMPDQKKREEFYNELCTRHAGNVIKITNSNYDFRFNQIKYFIEERLERSKTAKGVLA